MNLYQNLCKASDLLTHASNIYLVLEIVFISLLTVVLIKLFKRFRKIFHRLFITLLSLPLFAILSLISLFTILYLFGQLDDSPPSYRYHVLNAAIKNTCYLDPQRNRCPKTAEDLINIEPVNFRKLTKDAHLTYQYYPETNEYTLIIRSTYYHSDNDRVAVFDPRLIKLKENGFTGLDLYDAKIVNNCDGTFRIVNPPPIPGPWDKIN